MATPLSVAKFVALMVNALDCALQRIPMNRKQTPPVRVKRFFFIELFVSEGFAGCDFVCSPCWVKCCYIRANDNKEYP